MTELRDETHVLIFAVQGDRYFLSPTNESKDFFEKHELSSSVVNAIHTTLPTTVERAKFTSNKENSFYTMYDMRCQLLRGSERPRMPISESRRNLSERIDGSDVDEQFNASDTDTHEHGDNDIDSDDE